MGRSFRERVMGLFRRALEAGQPLHEGFIRVCAQCGHRWYARKKARPKRCPNTKCQSRRWDQLKEPADVPPPTGGPATPLSAADLDAVEAERAAADATTTPPTRKDA
jgi:hypothetical protein